MNNKLEPLNICCFLYDLKICSNNMEKYGPFALIGQCTNLKYLLNYFNYGLFRELFTDNEIIYFQIIFRELLNFVTFFKLINV